VLNHSSAPAKLRQRERLYDEAVHQALAGLWEAADRIGGKRLRVLIPVLSEAMERHGHLQLDPVVRNRLLDISVAAIDRLLCPERAATGRVRRRRWGTGSAVRQSVPVRTFAEWSARRDAPAAFRFVGANQAMHPIARTCRVLGVSPGGDYARLKRPPSARASADLELRARVAAIHRRSRQTYGAPRVHAELRAQGVQVGRKRVARPMRAANLRGVSRRLWTVTTVRDRKALPAPDLVERNFSAAAPNRLWVADITYIPTWAGFLYLAITPAIPLHGVILRHPRKAGRELWLNSPDLDAFSLFHQLRDTTQPKIAANRVTEIQLRIIFIPHRRPYAAQVRVRLPAGAYFTEPPRCFCLWPRGRAAETFWQSATPLRSGLWPSLLRDVVGCSDTGPPSGP